MEHKESIEWYFFKFAFPCSQVLLQLKRIDKKQYEDLKKNFEEGVAPSREVLETVFAAAFKRLKRLAETMKKKCWDVEVIEKYWGLEGHNHEINRGDGFYEKAPESFKDLCRINVAEVMMRKGKHLIVEYDHEGKSEKRIVFDDLVKDVQVGDKVRIHYGYAVESVD